MLFFNLEVLIGKPTKSIWIMAHLKFLKKMFLGQKKLKHKFFLQLTWFYENMVKFEPFKSH